MTFPFSWANNSNCLRMEGGTYACNLALRFSLCGIRKDRLASYNQPVNTSAPSGREGNALEEGRVK
jgi:hypothetical protein